MSGGQVDKEDTQKSQDVSVLKGNYEPGMRTCFRLGRSMVKT